MSYVQCYNLSTSRERKKKLYNTRGQLVKNYNNNNKNMLSIPDSLFGTLFHDSINEKYAPACSI